MPVCTSCYLVCNTRLGWLAFGLLVKMSASHTGVLGVTSGSVLDPSFLLMRTEREQQRWLTWERPGLCSSSWPHLGPTLDVACIWGMKSVIGRSFSLFLSLLFLSSSSGEIEQTNKQTKTQFGYFKAQIDKTNLVMFIQGVGI